MSVLFAGGVDYVGNPHPRRARLLAALAVKAIFKVGIEKRGVHHAQSLPVRAGLLGAGIGGKDLHHGAEVGADGALDALLEIIEAYVILLHRL